MTRSRSISRTGSARPSQSAGCSRKGSRLLLLVPLMLLLSGVPGAWAQPTADSVTSHTSVDSASTKVAAPVAQPASHWSTVWAVLGGVAIGALGVWLWSRKSQPVVSPVVPSASKPTGGPDPMQKKRAENVMKVPTEPVSAENADKGVSFQSLREVQSTTPKQSSSPSGKDKKSKPNFNSRGASSAKSSGAWPPIAPRASTMEPTPPSVPTSNDEQPLEAGQTIEWAAPTSTPPAIQELIDAGASEAPVAQAAPLPTEASSEPAPAAVATGPVHYYAPAPDVPSIEHRKLSPNPLPQMPLLITMPQAEALTAQFSFSPQADQSRIIGNGVRELKEFFTFELPPTEQFTTIKNLAPGKLEKRDDTWHVVQKAQIALG